MECVRQQIFVRDVFYTGAYTEWQPIMLAAPSVHTYTHFRKSTLRLDLALSY